MTTTEFLQCNSKKETVSALRKLERENLLKNSFLLELKQVAEDCYHGNLNHGNKNVESLLKLIYSRIDGVTQNSLELSNVSCLVDNVSEYLEEL